MENQESFKVVFVGGAGTGAKTSLINYIIGVPFKECIESTGAPSYAQFIRSTSLGKIRINLWDTIGQEKYIQLTKIFYKNTDCFIIGFDITSKSSFNSIEYFYNGIKSNMDNNPLFYLVGNKSDLFMNREIKEEEAMDYAKEKNIKYFEVSAKQGSNVEELMNDVTNSLIQKYKDENKQDILNRIIIENKENKEKKKNKENKKKKCLIF